MAQESKNRSARRIRPGRVRKRISGEVGVHRGNHTCWSWRTVSGFSSAGRLGLVVLAWFLLALTFASVPSTGQLLLCVAFAGLGLSRWAYRDENRSREGQALVLGIACSVLPAFGSGTLLVFAAFWFLTQAPLRRALYHPWAFPLLLPPAIWLLVHWWVAFDLVLWRDVLLPAYSRAGVFAAWQAGGELLRAAPPDYIRGSVAFFRLWVFASLVVAFVSAEHLRRAFFRGVLFGLPLGVLALGVQILAPELVPFPNQHGFWRSLERWSASYTDPNAFGVFFATAFPLLFASRLPLVTKFGFGIALFAAGLFSGSRAFFLAIGIYGAAMMFATSKRKWMLAAGSLGAALVTLNLLPVGIFDQHEAFFPSGVQRILASLRFDAVAETFYSRAVFFRMAVEAWLDHPLVGTGYGRFASFVVPYAHELNFETGTWTDNANSFYLSLLAETGLFGFAGFLLALTNLTWTGAASRWFGRGVVCMAVLLIIGPHLHFDEVALLFAGILAAVVQPKARLRSSPSFLTVSIVAAGLMLLKAPSMNYGFYPWEQSTEDASYFRWSRSRAGGTIVCNQEGHAQLRFRVAHPDLPGNPVQVRFQGPNQEQRFLLTRPHQTTVEFECAPLPEWARRDERRELRWTMEVSRLWVPKDHLSGSNDPRPLGLQMLGLAPEETLP